MKQILVQKSGGLIVSMFVGLILGLVGSVFLIQYAASGEITDTRMQFYLIGFPIIAIFSAVMFIWGLVTPRVLIRYDEAGIYLYGFRKKETFIAYHDIINVEGRAVYSREFYLKPYGRIRIISRQHNYILNWVYGLNDVVDRIVALKISAEIDHDRKQERFVDKID